MIFLLPRVIDLRSDTVTKPSPEMWEALRNLNDEKIGDDVFREDPTVNELEELAAKKTGKEAALLVTSGSQGNLTCLLSFTRPGNEILIESSSHILLHEVGSAARIGGLMPRTYDSDRGVPSLSTLESLIRPRDDDHQPWTTLVCVENTHNKHGGAIIPVDFLRSLKNFSLEKDLKIHMDGARIFNAAIAKDVPVSKFVENVDSMTFCLSKGLSCPIGSLIVGSQEFINEARKFRKMLGGGMRQAGIIAIMGLIALQDKWLSRLREDHVNASHLAKGLEESSLHINIVEPETNIVIIECPASLPLDKVIRELKKEGILAFSFENKIRLVTHYGITKEDINVSIETITRVFRDFV